MPRSDEYIVNEEGVQSPYDIQLDGTGFSFFGNEPIRGKFGPGKTTAEGGPGEAALIFNDLSNGMGMAYSGIPNTYAFAENMYVRTPRKFMPAGKLTEIDLTDLGWTADELAGEIRCGLEWFGDVYFGAGQHIIKMITASEAPVDEYFMGEDTQIDGALVYNNIPIFSTDESFDNWQYLTAYDVLDGAWKTANSNGSNPDYSVQTGADNYELYTQPVYLQKMIKVFQEVDGTGGNRIVGNNSPYTYVQTQTDNIDTMIGDFSAWSSALPVGDSTYAITGFYETNRIFFVTKADGVYGIESSGIYCPNYVPGMKKSPSTYNGVSGDYFSGKLFVGSQEGLYMVEVNNKQVNDVPMLVNPSFYFANETPVYGIPVATEVDNGWLVVALWNGSDSHVCYTRPRENTLATIPNPVIWHGSECTIPGERITMLFKTGASGVPQMFIGTHDGTRMHLYTLSLPGAGDPFTDYLNGGLHQFAIDSKIFIPFQDADDPNAKKVIRRFDVQADGLSLPIYAEADDPETGVVIGDLIGTISAGEISFYANADAGSRIFFESYEPTNPLSEWEFQGIVSNSPRATMIPSITTTSGYQIGILLVGTLLNREEDEELAPIYSPFAVRSVKVRTDINVEQIEQKTYTLQISKEKWTQVGRDQNDHISKFVTLSSLQDADAVYMVTEERERILVKVEPGIEYTYMRETVDKPYTRVVTLTITFLGRQFYYDIGHQYDGIYAWGS